jgi:trigger factor
MANTVSFKKLPGSVIELSVSIPLAEFKQEADRAFERARAELEIKGFRKGMVPQPLAREVLSPKKIFDDAAERAVKLTLTAAAHENGWTVVDRPTIDIRDDAAAFSYTATFSVFPAIDITGYDAIAREHRALLDEKKASLSVTAEEEEESLRWLRESRATLTAHDRGAAKGDAVEIEIQSSIGDLPHADRFVLGAGRFMPGFEDRLIGHAAGETISFTLVAPADYWKEALRGKPIDFTVTMKSVLARSVPEATDAFAASLGTIKDLAELKKNIRDGLLAEKARREEDIAAQKMLEAITLKAAIDIPEAMVKAMKERNPNASDVDLKRTIATHLVIYEIAERESLRPTDEEVREGIDHHNAGSRGKESIDTPQLRDYIYERIQQQNVYAKLLGTDSH